MNLAKWLYRGGRPNWLASVANRCSAAVHMLGIAPNYLVTLEVRGRRSGRTVSLPLVMAVVSGERYLVSMLGPDANWVRNAKAAGRHVSTRCLRIAHPICVRPQHRYQIPFTADDGHDQRQADGATGSPAAHFQCHQVIGGNPEHVDRSGASVGDARQPIRAPTTIEPFRQVHWQSIPDRVLRQLRNRSA